MGKNLTPFAAPSLGAWSSLSDITGLALTETSSISVGFVGALATDTFGIYFAPPGTATPSGTPGGFAPPGLAVPPGSSSPPSYAGPGPNPVGFSALNPCPGTGIFIYRFAGSSSVSVQISGEAPAGASSGGGSPFVNGGNSFGATGNLGTTDANQLNIFANNVVGVVLSANGNSTHGSAIGTASTALQSGSGGTSITSTGAITMGTSTATSVTIGNQTGAFALTLNGGSGGIAIGIPGGGAGGVAIQGGTSSSSFGVGAGATLALGGGAVANTVTLGTGAAVKTVTVGSTNTTSTTTFLFGSGGSGYGTAAPGGSGIAIDTPVAAQITIGVTNANNITLGNATGPTTVAINAGTGGISGNATGAGGVGLAAGASGNASLIGGTGGAKIDATGAVTVGPTSATSVVTGNTTASIRHASFTTTQRNAIATSLPPTGSEVFNTTTGEPEINIGTAAAPIWAAQAAQFSGAPLTLTAGAVTVTGVNLTTNSVILISVAGPANSALTVRYDVLTANRTNGAPGSFTINALIAAGTINAADTSSGVRWTIIGQ